MDYEWHQVVEVSKIGDDYVNCGCLERTHSIEKPKVSSLTTDQN